MVDITRREGDIPPDQPGDYLVRRWREIRAGEYAPEVASFMYAVANEVFAVEPRARKVWPVDRSGTTSAIINTSIVAAAADDARTYLFIQNVGAADIWVNFGAAANAGQGSIKLTPNSSLTFENNIVPSNSVNVLSGAASVPYTMKETL